MGRVGEKEREWAADKKQKRKLPSSTREVNNTFVLHSFDKLGTHTYARIHIYVGIHWHVF